jgi:hypothetical protein
MSVQQTKLDTWHRPLSSHPASPCLGNLHARSMSRLVEQEARLLVE